MKENKHMSFTDAAERILRDAAKPVSYSKIAQEALRQGLIQSEAEDPAVSLYVVLRTEIKRRKERNEPQRFNFLGNGVFELIGKALPTKTKSALEEVRESRKRACQNLYEQLIRENRGSEFEQMVSDLLLAMGYQNVQVIGGSDDHGVDIICERREGLMVERFAIQCKCKALNKKIGPKDISTLRDNLSTYQCQRGILITTSELNNEAREKAKEPGKVPVDFIEHKDIFDLFAEHGVGIKGETIKYFEVATEQYEFLKLIKI